MKEREEGVAAVGSRARVAGKAPDGVFIEGRRTIIGRPIHQECNVEVSDESRTGRRKQQERSLRRWEEKWASDGLYFRGGRAKKWPEKQSAWPFKIFIILPNNRKDQRNKKKD
jgi:hypothetical protein